MPIYQGNPVRNSESWRPRKKSENLGFGNSGERGGIVIPFQSLRATEGSVAISWNSDASEIASIVSLPRNDLMTQPRKPESRNGHIF